MVHLRTLGELRLEETDAPALSSRRKELVLLAYLARRGQRPLPRAEAAALLWPERDERRARQSLRQALLELRQVVGEGFVVEQETVRLAPGAVDLDAAAFERELDAGQTSTAVGRWRGDFLPGAEEVGGEELRGWLESERERLRRRLAIAFAELIDDAQQRGATQEGVDWAERWVSALPLDQHGHVRLLRLLHLQGRSGDALSRCTALRARLRGLEIEPLPELDRLARQMERAGDAARRPRLHSAAVRTPDLAGRGRAYAELDAAWRRARDGRGAAALVEGELGIGKTRLCQEFLLQLERTGEKHASARARPREGSHHTELGTIAELASALADAPGLAGTPAASLAVLAALAPSIAARFPTTAPTPAAAETALVAFSDALKAVAAEVPVALFVDDFPRTDHASRQVLLALAERVPDGVLLLATARTGDGASPVPLPAAPHVLRLKLQPLASEEIELLVGSMLELQPQDRRHLAARLHQHGGGNPFYIVELVSALADDGVLVPTDRGEWRLMAKDSQLPLPSGVREVVTRRLARLTPPGRTALEAAAVLALPFDRGLLAEVAGESPVAVEAGLQELLANRLIKEAGRSGLYEFTHEMVRHHVERNVQVMKAEAMSLRAFSALHRRGCDEPAATAALEHHRVRAERVAAVARRKRHGRVAAAVIVLAGVGAAIGTRGPPEPASTSALAVLPFTVSGAPELAYLRDGMASLLSTQLDGVGTLRAVDPRAVLGMANQVKGSPPAAEAGKRVAELVGAGTYVIGDIVEAGGRVRIIATAYRPTDPSQPVARAEVTGRTAELFDLVDGVAGRLLTGLNPGPYQQLTRVAATTTGSLPALKAYLDGERLFRQGSFGPAASAFQRAALEDTTFGLASYWLSVALWWGDDSEGIDVAAARAVRYGKDLPERYQRLFLAWHAFLRGDPVEAERLYRQVLELEPENVEAWLQLGEVQFHSGPRRGHSMGAAATAFERVLYFEPEHTSALLHLARIAANESRLPALDSLTRRMLELSPTGQWAAEAKALRSFATGDIAEQREVIAELRTAGEGQVWNIALYLAIAAHSLEGAKRLLDLLTEATRSPEVRAFGHLALAQLQLARGRARAAARELDRAAALDPVAALQHRALLATVPFLPAPSSELATLRDTISRLGSSRTPPNLETSHLANLHDAVQDELRAYLAAGLSLRLGDSVAARRYLSELEAPVRLLPRASVGSDAAASVRARLALRGGRTAEAVRDLHEALRLEARVGLIGGSPFYSQGLERFLYAGALAEAGRLEDATRWYRSFSSNSIFDLMYLAPASLERGRIAERQGDVAAAASHYQRAIALWLNSDQELRAIPDRARARIVSLQSRGDSARARR